MKSRLPLASFLAMQILIGVAYSGTTGKIAGTVRDSQTGEGLVGATVVIEGTSLGAAANIEGYFVILNVAPGRYRVSASSVGYTKKTVTDVAISVDLTTKQDFGLASSVVQAEEVVVTADRPLVKRDLTSSESRVDARTIESLPVQEVSAVLSLQAGITVDRGGGIHIRGGRTNEVAYWVDGVSVSDVYDGGQAVQVDNNAIQELQVISGTFNAEYGQAMSGIVNIVTKDGDQSLRGNLKAYMGDFVSSDKDLFYNIDKVRPLDTRNLEGSLSGPIPGISAFTFYLSGRYFRTDGHLFGNRVYDINGVAIPGVDSVRDAQGRLLYINAPSNPVPMNNRERFSGQFKLTWQVSGPIKLGLSGLASKIDYRDYNRDWKYLPDGDVNKFDRGYNVAGIWTHTLGSASFYTLNVSFFRKQFREYLFENPLDPRYILDPAVFNRPQNTYITHGTNNHQFKRTTETRVAKLDFTSQVSKLHQLKLGFEGRLHRLYLEDYNITYNEDTNRVTGRFIPTIPDKNGPNYSEYTEKPVELSGYLQDKLEYENMIVNIGVRFDYFNSNGKVLADPQDPNVNLPQKAENQALSPEERLAKWYKDAKARYSISPRFGISYPITDKGVLHFSYGHFLQIPSFERLYQSPGYKVTSALGLQGVFGNPDLKPQKTVMYEFGLQQQLTEDLGFDVTGFYRDTRDWVATSPAIPVRDPERATTSYTIFINKDYANSRGITLSANKRMSNMWSLAFSYTYQTAEGNNSTPDEEQAAQSDNREPARSLTPLDWDQSHTANLSLGFGEKDWGLFLIGRYGSGLPYTPVLNQLEGRGEDVSRGIKKNSRRRPDNVSIDLRLFKSFSFGGLDVSLFATVYNLLDTRNELDVYGETGRAVATPEQLGIGRQSGDNRVNTLQQYVTRPEFYSEPREIQIGVELNF